MNEEEEEEERDSGNVPLCSPPEAKDMVGSLGGEERH